VKYLLNSEKHARESSAIKRERKSRSRVSEEKEEARRKKREKVDTCESEPVSSMRSVIRRKCIDVLALRSPFHLCTLTHTRTYCGTVELEEERKNGLEWTEQNILRRRRHTVASLSFSFFNLSYYDFYCIIINDTVIRNDIISDMKKMKRKRKSKREREK